MSALSRNFCASATRTLRTRTGIRGAGRALRPAIAVTAPRTVFRQTNSSTFAAFSTMSPLQSGGPIPKQSQEYDKEVKDIASYVHSYNVNSDLAVRMAFS